MMGKTHPIDRFSNTSWLAWCLKSQLTVFCREYNAGWLWTWDMPWSRDSAADAGTGVDDMPSPSRALSSFFLGVLVSLESPLPSCPPYVGQPWLLWWHLVLLSIPPLSAPVFWSAVQWGYGVMAFGLSLGFIAYGRRNFYGFLDHSKLLFSTFEVGTVMPKHSITERTRGGTKVLLKESKRQ